MTNDTKLGTATLLFRCAEQLDLQPEWIGAGSIFAITIGGRESYINFANSPLNSHLSATLAKNKYLTRVILKRNKLPNIPFGRPKTLEEAELFLAAHGKIIVKPVTGSNSHDIHIIKTLAQLKDFDVSHYIFEKYVAGKELRYLVIKGKVVAVHQSDYGVSVAEDRALKRISYPEAAWDPILSSLSVKIAALIGLNFAAVDFLVDALGHAHILEVNSSPGLKWFHAPTSGPVVDVAHMFMETMLEAMPPTGVKIGLSARPAYY